MENNPIDKYFSSRISNIDIKPTSDGWQRVEDLLDPKPRKSMTLLWLIVCIILTTVTLIYFLNTTPNQPNEVPSNLPMAIDDNQIKNDITKDKEQDLLIEDTYLLATSDAPNTDMKANISSATTQLTTNEVLSNEIVSKNIHQEKRPGLAALVRLPMANRAMLAMDNSQIQLKEIHPKPFIPKSGRTLVINLIKKPKRDTVIMTTPNQDSDTKKSLFAAIKESPSKGGIINKVREAKNDLFNKKN